MNESSRPAAGASLARRLLAYQAERFPLAGFAPLITSFAFSSAAFSPLARGEMDGTTGRVRRLEPPP